MIYISGHLYNILNGEFGIGIYTQRGMDEEGNEFSEIVLAFLFFEIAIGNLTQ